MLKEHFPGWWTGKISDFAGVAVAGTLAAVLIGPRRGLALVGTGFLLLKTTPGFAEAARPLLGGVTARDASDLVALTILIPMTRLFRSSVGGAGTPVLGSGQLVRGLRAGMSAGVPLAAAIVAVIAATATSCDPSPAVTRVVVADETFFALVSRGWGDPEWARSEDGGHSWERSAPPQGMQPASPRPGSPFEDPGPTGPLKACASDGTCWHLRGQRVIERGSPGGDRVEELRLSDAQFSAISTGCAGGHVGILGSVAVAEGRPGPNVVASLGADGVLTRHENGRWEATRVLSAPPIAATPIETAASWGLLVFGPILALAMWLFGRRRWPSWPRGVGVILMGWLMSFVASSALGFAAESDSDPTVAVGRVAIVGMVVTTVVAIVVARRQPPATAHPPS
ncbi:MAG: hypothetical protein WD206_09155 [Actinomycetota bacterium]